MDDHRPSDRCILERKIYGYKLIEVQYQALYTSKTRHQEFGFDFRFNYEVDYYLIGFFIGNYAVLAFDCMASIFRRILMSTLYP